MAQARSPRSSIVRNAACTSIASGVVSAAGRSSPPITVATPPSRPQGVPVASSRWRTRCVVVVFPLVPVTPTTASSAVGSPK